MTAEAEKGATESATSGPALLPASGRECPICRKSNHAGVSQCLFCGSDLASASRARDASAWVNPTDTTPGIAPVSEAGTSSRPFPSDTTPGSQRFSIDDEELPSAPAADPLLGVIVAERYRIVELLGRGGMGIVYKVEHTRIGKLLAMKLLTGELSRNPEVVRRFKQEALTVSKLSSPNTVQVFDFGAAEGLTYLVMELVSGEDLGRALRTLGPMRFSRLGKIMIQACSSLAEAHQKGIVHRDIKPENIMLLRGRDGNDIAKVLDFGLAKLREGAELNDLTSQGAIVGTPYFMAPEQVRGEAVDARTDVYAMGALMYRALTGHYPFSGATPMAVFTKHLMEMPIPPIERSPELDIPPRISQLVMKALSKDPADRVQRVEDLQAVLVEEVRAMGTSSVDDLLVTGRVRQMSSVARGPSTNSAIVRGVEIATRDEVEAYERKLRRQRYGAVAIAGGCAFAIVAVGTKVALTETEPAFMGFEMEPNNTAADATKVPLGRVVSGMLGKRMDVGYGDRDFYTIDVPFRGANVPVYLKLNVGALPNFATCTMLYRPGFANALGQYCIGRPGRELVIPALRIEPGRLLVAVMQDLDPYGGRGAPFVYENVSDAYTLTADVGDVEAGDEIEPNDEPASANTLAVGASIEGVSGWARDVDVFCLAESDDAPAPGRIRWKVRDSLRDNGVLEVTPMRGTEEGAPVRLHAGTSKQKPTTSDALTPWASEPLPAEEQIARCLRVRLASDPWSPDKAGVVPSGGSQPYVVEIEAVP